MTAVTRLPDVVVIGAGVVGAACTWHAVRAGLNVCVVDRGAVAGGTTGAGEGDLLVSDKAPGPELDLAMLSLRLWADLADEVGGFEYERKGGLVVADSAAAVRSLEALRARQTESGVDATTVPADDLHDYEPHLAEGMTGGVHYPADAQVQPMLAAARLLSDARARGARLRLDTDVTGLIRAGSRVVGVRTSAGDLPAGAVVNAAGTWAGAVAGLAGVAVPIAPRRGYILVTEPLPKIVRHKVYAADYVEAVASDDAALQASAVVEGTFAGPILIGSSRERVGFDRTMSVAVLRRLAAAAIKLFPILRTILAIRAYCGFRPYTPDHLPVIGPDSRAPGLFQACGHEGAGVGLAAATGRLIALALAGQQPGVDPSPFRPERFG